MHEDVMRAFDLSGRTAIVTGAGMGIGRAAAILFAKAGADVVVADRRQDALAETEKAIVELGRNALAVGVDVSVRAEVDALVASAVDRFGRLDVMANVAGIIRNAAFVDVTEEELDELIGVNQKGVFFGCAAAGRVMAEQGSGAIINIASAGMDTPAPGIAVYAMTKAAVAMLTRSLAVELGELGVRVNTVAPGFIDTPMTRRSFTSEEGGVDAETRDEVWSRMSGMAPLGKIGDVEDVALAMLYLASDASRYVTGQVLRPNGGVAMP